MYIYIYCMGFEGLLHICIPLVLSPLANIYTHICMEAYIYIYYSIDIYIYTYIYREMCAGILCMYMLYIYVYIYIYTYVGCEEYVGMLQEGLWQKVWWRPVAEEATKVSGRRSRLPPLLDAWFPMLGYPC